MQQESGSSFVNIPKNSLSLRERVGVRAFTLFVVLCFFTSTALALPIDVKNYKNFDKNDDDKQKLHEEAVELESVLISNMIEPMFPDGKESGLYGGGHGSDIFRQMMIDQYARVIAQKNGLGLAENIEKNLQK
jgi:Rod binding domain-containing protein